MARGGCAIGDERKLLGRQDEQMRLVESTIRTELTLDRGLEGLPLGFGVGAMV